MKIRSDFVTNSSSSSFTVSLDVKLVDGTQLTIGRHHDCGDFDGDGISFSMIDAAGETVMDTHFDPLVFCMNETDLLDPDEIPYEVAESISGFVDTTNLLAIQQAEDAESLIAAIQKPLDSIAVCLPDEEDEEEYEFEDESAAEILQQMDSRLTEILEDSTEALKNAITSPADLQSVTMDLEFSGFGEFLKDADEILDQIFEYEEKKQIVAILEDEGEDAVAALENLDFMKAFTPSSIQAIVDFWQDCDCPPSECNVRQTLLPNGLIDMTISYEV